MGDISKINNTSSDPTTHVSPTISNAPLKGEEYKNDMPTPEDLDSRWLRWKCLVCGYVYEGVMPVKKCPKCGNENPDKFEDV